MSIKRITPMFEWPKPLPVMTGRAKRAREDFMVHCIRCCRKNTDGRALQRRGAFTEPIKPGSRTSEIGLAGAHIESKTYRSSIRCHDCARRWRRRSRPRFPQVEVLVGDVHPGCRVKAASSTALLQCMCSSTCELAGRRGGDARFEKPDGFFPSRDSLRRKLAYTFCRNISARRIFESQQNVPTISSSNPSHVNLAEEIVFALKKHSRSKNRSSSRCRSFRCRLASGHSMVCRLSAIDFSG